MFNLELVAAVNDLYESYPQYQDMIMDLYNTAVKCINEGLYTEADCILSMYGTVESQYGIDNRLTVTERIALLESYERVDLIRKCEDINSRYRATNNPLVVRKFICTMPTPDLIGMIVNYGLYSGTVVWSKK